MLLEKHTHSPVSSELLYFFESRDLDMVESCSKIPFSYWTLSPPESDCWPLWGFSQVYFFRELFF